METSDDAAFKRQATALESAITQFQAAQAQALEADAQLRLSALYYWSIYDFPPAIAAAKEAQRLFAGLLDRVMLFWITCRFRIHEAAMNDIRTMS